MSADNIEEIYDNYSDENDEYSSLTTEIHKKELLRNWVLRNQVSHKATNELLVILRDFFGASFLPKDSRTFLSTPRETLSEIRQFERGEYWHNGLERSLKRIFSDIEENAVVRLSFNIDGLPTFNSSQFEFWPILARVDNYPKLKPIIIGIYCGEGKPLNVNEYLDPFVKELKQCVENGIMVNDRKINVEINCFICDTPARCFIKGNLYCSCVCCTLQ